MNILLVYPRYPETFWSFKHALKFIAKKAAFPPLGLLTVASMLPSGWNKKVVDMNTDHLRDKDLAWADYVFVSAMDIQRESACQVIKKCRELGKKVVAGGPLFHASYEDFDDVDHFVLGEAESTLALFLLDLARGKLQRVYQSDEWPDIRRSPAPAWNLVDIRKYATLSVQYCRGCPHNCEFCDVVLLNGHTPRTKDTGQLLEELDVIYRLGYRGSVFLVDDNFIGNKRKLKEATLPAIIKWGKEKGYPFTFFTQTSINLADDEELMVLMADAGFTTVFVGIETPEDESLGECGKSQNRSRDLVASVKTLQNHGLQVQGGFIVGFDSDPSNIFEKQINFVQQSGIVTAMVGLLNAPKGTRLYKRLMGENRLLQAASGDNTDFSLNFVPKMNKETLIKGYGQILASIYSQRQYYDRIRMLLREHKPVIHGRRRVSLGDLRALVRTTWYLGIREKGRRHYWRIVGSTLLKRPRSLPMVLTLAVYGYHFRKLIEGRTS